MRPFFNSLFPLACQSRYVRHAGISMAATRKGAGEACMKVREFAAAYSWLMVGNVEPDRISSRPSGGFGQDGGVVTRSTGRPL